MGFFMLLISILFIVEGVVLILAPKKLVKIAEDILKVKNYKMFGIVPLLFGIIFLLGVSTSALGWLVIVLGLASIAKAVYLFLAPLSKIKAHWWFSLSENNQRAWGILVLILGVVLFISLR